MFKHIFDKDFERLLPSIIQLLDELQSKNTGLQYIETLMRYVLINVENMTGDKLKAIIAESIKGPEGGKEVLIRFTTEAQSAQRG